MCDKQSFRPAWPRTARTDKPYNTFICPKCGYPQFCGCKSCKDRIPEGFLPYKWKSEPFEGHEPLELYICANCGFEASIDWWMDESVKQYKDRLIK